MGRYRNDLQRLELRRALCKIVENEDPTKPYTDIEIAGALGMSRPMVKYYRETLGIKNSRFRKTEQRKIKVPKSFLASLKESAQ